MSVDDNKVHVRSMIEDGWNRKNPAAFDARIAAEFVAHTPSGEFRGLDGYKQLYGIFTTAFPDCRFTIDDIIAEGDKVSMSYTFAGTHTGPLQDVAPTGRRVSVPGVSISRHLDGKIVEDHAVWDGMGLMRQLGLAP